MVPASPQSTVAPVSSAGVTARCVGVAADPGPHRAQRGDHEVGVTAAQRPGDGRGPIGERGEDQCPVGDGFGARQGHGRVDGVLGMGRWPETHPSIFAYRHDSVCAWSRTRSQRTSPRPVNRRGLMADHRVWPGCSELELGPRDGDRERMADLHAVLVGMGPFADEEVVGPMHALDSVRAAVRGESRGRRRARY